MNAKTKGNRRERQARRILELAGYHVVKAGGSLGVFDLVALWCYNLRELGENLSTRGCVRCFMICLTLRFGKVLLVATCP